jgi:2-polyprenyl-6-methoxyphenol hydroxylase-like FAD-dependent oxidoreductase
MAESRRFGDAIVIGGSMAGLLAARVLSDHFAHVTLIERDTLPEGAEQRKGVPQGKQGHGLLSGGQQVMEALFPGLTAELVAEGATTLDVINDMRWHQPGGYRLRFDSGLQGISMSRPLLEAGIRRRVKLIANIAVIDGREVTGLTASADRTRVTGITFRRRGEGNPEETLAAEFVVDAGGRGSHAPAWLEALGYERPEEEKITVGVGYTTRLYRRHPGDLPDAQAAICQPTPPHETRIAVLLPIEGDRWIATCAGWLGDHAPADDEGFLAFARSLPAPDIYNVITNAEPLGDYVTHKFPANLRRRYERLKRVPEGYVVAGDALCSFNPTYGQGMTAAAMTVAALADCLRERRVGLQGLPSRFYRRAAKVIDTPWQMAAGGDFAYPEVTGKKATGTDVINRYMGRIFAASTTDRHVCRKLVEVANLLAPPSALFAPRVVFGVLRHSFRRRQTVGVARAVPAPSAGD